MREALFYLASSFWAGAAHAATPGHGKTISAAYIVGARGRPIDAVILGVFVTLSHTSGIVLVGILASLGSSWLVPQRIEAWLGVVLGVLVIALGCWILWTQRRLIGPALSIQSGDHPHDHYHHHSHEVTHEHHHSHELLHEHTHGHEHEVEHEHEHGHGAEHSHPTSLHSHGWGTHWAHRFDVVSDQRPKLGVLLMLGIAGGLLPDPTALAILLAAISNGRMLLGLGTVLVFSLGFAVALLLVGIAAAQIGQRVLVWLDSIWALRLQLATTVLILGMGVVLTVQAVQQLVRLLG